MTYQCSNPFSVSALSPKKPTRFDVTATAVDLLKMTAFFEIISVKTFKFRGEITPKDKYDFVLIGHLVATVEQACIISLEPVFTKITEEVTLTYLCSMPIPDADDVEIPEDDTLALPPFPRLQNATLTQAVFTAPGVKPFDSADVNPFAGLAGLVERLTKPPKAGD
jgi:uncharacterized metal-binding protein YceD (DUF177 family)